MIDQSSRSVRSGIGFGLGSKYETVRNGKQFDICYTLERNDFRGQAATVLMIKDIHSSDSE